jgi:hypothetical protein
MQKALKGTGRVRLIVVKHNDQNYGGIYRNSNPNTITVISASFFPHGFICVKSWNNEISRPEYTEDMIREESEVIAESLEGHPNGFYEIVAGLGFTSWKTSYEYEEYDHQWCLLDPSINVIKYEHAAALDQYNVIGSESIDLMTQQGGFDRDKGVIYSDTMINQFMPKHEINARHAYTLTRLNNSYDRQSLWDFAKMTEQELKDYIFMAMLQIDSESNLGPTEEKKHKLALIIDEDVLHWQDLRSGLFDSDDE